jgi:hypothetical protein
MKLRDIVERLGLEPLTPELETDTTDIREGYVSDLLSDVLANGPQGGVLVTVQVHLNVVAVAVHAELAAVIFAMDRRPDEAVRQKAAEEGIRLFVSEATAFEIVGRLHELGVRGRRA